MDEPCSALDPIATRKIEELMLELKTRYTIAIVTHNLQQAQRVADNTGISLCGHVGRRTDRLPCGVWGLQAVFESPARNIRKTISGENLADRVDSVRHPVNPSLSDGAGPLRRQIRHIDNRG